MTELERAAKAVASGDRAAFAVIVRATERQLLRVGARLLGSEAAAADVLQDAYLRAFDALSSGDFQARASVGTWLYRIVVNGALDARRAAARRPAEPLDELGGHAASGSAVDARLALRELSDWLAKLPDDQRAALVLKELEGLSSAEVARVLRISEGAVEQRLVRARATLRRLHEEA